MPLGNLTSQLLSNIYLNEFDQFVKHKLKARYYIRYSDDFVILSENKKYLENKINPIKNFLQNELNLTLHSDKIYIETLSSGMDFLGWKHFFNHRILRRTTERKMLRKIKGDSRNTKTLNSYLGLLKHGNTYKVKRKILQCYRD